MISLTILETNLETGKPEEPIQKMFSGKTADTDLQKFLEALHFNKMNEASLAAGIGGYTLSKITKPSKWNRVAYWRDETDGYMKVQAQIKTSLKISIEHY